MYDYNPYYNTYYRNYNYNTNYNYNPYYYPPTYTTKTYKGFSNEKTSTVNKNNDIPNNSNTTEKDLKLGPLHLGNDRIEILGFSIAIDDLIIIALIILLFLQSDKDYTLLIVLGLMLFNVSLSNFDFSKLNLF